MSRAQKTFVPKPSFFVSESGKSVLPSETVLRTPMFYHCNATKTLLPKSELSLTQLHTECVNPVQLVQKVLNHISILLSVSFLNQICLG